MQNKVSVFFGALQVKYIGYIISKEEVTTDPKKVQAVQKWSQPRTLKHLRGFLGLSRYYKGFIKNYGQIAHPLTDLLKNDNFT